MSISPTSIAIIAVSLAAAAFLGFAAHRASFCSVKAVAEIISTRRAYMFTSFMKITIWVFALALPLSWLVPASIPPAQTWAFGWPAVAGGLLFGVGATANGGCAFYTLTRLSSGNLALLFTLTGFLLGYIVQSRFLGAFANPPASPTVMLYDQPRIASLSLLAIVWLLFFWEIGRLWRSCQHKSWRDRLLAKRYRFSSAAIMFGFSNALLFVFWGPWAYTSALHQQVIAMGANAVKFGLFAAVLAGMTFSSWQRGDGCLTWGKRRLWGIHLAGGTLMGMGAAMAPGGNDALMLYGIPMFSPHALPAFAAMLVAIAVTLLLGRAIVGLNIQTNCKGDRYRSDRDDH